jgi:hypothetical protein
VIGVPAALATWTDNKLPVAVETLTGALRATPVVPDAGDTLTAAAS